MKAIKAVFPMAKLNTRFFWTAMANLSLLDTLRTRHPVDDSMAHRPQRHQGVRYDCGSKLGYLQATLAMALKHPEVGADFKRLLLEQAEALMADEQALV
jgi:UTP-glucose-1-phosphate uridylyltransferase